MIKGGVNIRRPVMKIYPFSTKSIAMVRTQRIAPAYGPVLKNTQYVAAHVQKSFIKKTFLNTLLRIAAYSSYTPYYVRITCVFVRITCVWPKMHTWAIRGLIRWVLTKAITA